MDHINALTDFIFKQLQMKDNFLNLTSIHFPLLKSFPFDNTVSNGIISIEMEHDTITLKLSNHKNEIEPKKDEICSILALKQSLTTLCHLIENEEIHQELFNNTEQSFPLKYDISLIFEKIRSIPNLFQEFEVTFLQTISPLLQGLSILTFHEVFFSLFLNFIFSF